MAQRKADRDAAKAKVIEKEVKAEETGGARSFKAVALKWHEWWASGVDSETSSYILRRLQSDVFPAFGHEHINEVKPSDIRNLIIAIEKRCGARTCQRPLSGSTPLTIELGEVVAYTMART